MLRGLAIERLLVRSLEVGRKEVTWETGSGPSGTASADPRDFTFQVLRSESPEGPFEARTEAFEDRYLFVDTFVPEGNKFRQLWYKIRVTHKASGDTEDFGPATQEAEPDLVAAYIRRNEQTLFTQVTGRRCWLLKKRTFGPRCPSCWDSTTQKRTRANCLDCFNQGFLRGFHDPIEVWVQIDPSGRGKKTAAQQIEHEVFASARMTFYPNVSPGDVLIEAENKRWRILTVTPSERLRAVVKQEMTMRQIQSTDIEYRIPLNIQRALRDVQPSPPRMFALPSDLWSSIDERTPNVFANYETYPTDSKEE